MSDQPKPRKQDAATPATGDAHRLFEPEDEPNIISRSTPSTGEWTAETIRQFWRDNQKLELCDDEQWNTFFQSVADAHKASLAAKEKECADVMDAHELKLKLEFDAALAAERDIWDNRIAKKHCKDCCCAISWEALGITGYTGKSIPEHILQLREQLAAHKKELSKLIVELNKRNSQLAAAQAAISDHNVKVHAGAYGQWQVISFADTTSLDAAIKESYEKGRQDERNSINAK